ncbi:hypothetical protein [Bacillus toyonensis]|uniref:Uncharacterized protein n=1 Tax=Bacillus toyonensis TaxID=155322 RepID=A0A2A8H6J0_9BACI|nr:hypothetical protein [Bacillus toyonensis]PEP88751.1 hypothetical protein CN585_29200 [Bacillus toyonensis]
MSMSIQYIDYYLGGLPILNNMPTIHKQKIIKQLLEGTPFINSYYSTPIKGDIFNLDATIIAPDLHENTILEFVPITQKLYTNSTYEIQTHVLPSVVQETETNYIATVTQGFSFNNKEIYNFSTSIFASQINQIIAKTSTEISIPYNFNFLGSNFIHEIFSMIIPEEIVTIPIRTHSYIEMFYAKLIVKPTNIYYTGKMKGYVEQSDFSEKKYDLWTFIQQNPNIFTPETTNLTCNYENQSIDFHAQGILEGVFLANDFFIKVTNTPIDENNGTVNIMSRNLEKKLLYSSNIYVS